MKNIKRDFIIKEFGRSAVCAVGFAICIIVLILSRPGLLFAGKLLFLGAAAVIALSALRSAVQYRINTNDLNDYDQYLLEKEYIEPHPVYKVWQGEMHLMKSFIVCRNRGRLLFIPVHQIERIEQRFNMIGMRRIPVIKFIMDTDKSVSIGFSVSHSNDSEIVFSRLADMIGRDKVVYEGH